MDFKASILQDIDKVFLNPSEFAEVATIGKKNPIQVTVTMDNEALKTMGKHNEKLANSELLFYVALDALGYIPQVEKVLYFNEKQYLVTSVSDQMGMLQIALSRVTG